MADLVDLLAHGGATGEVLAQLDVGEDSPWLGRTLAEVTAEMPSSVVLGLRRDDGRLIVGPSGASGLEAGDAIVVIVEEGEVGGFEATER